MLVNLRDVIEKMPENAVVDEFHLVYGDGDKNLVFEGKGSIPWDAMPNLEYDDEDAIPTWGGWASYTDGSWVEMVVAEATGRYYFDWLYRKRPTLS